jgi:hypothetical protein
MTKTAEHLAAAIAALAELKGDGEPGPSVSLHIHGGEEVQAYVAGFNTDGYPIRTEETEEGRKFTVAQAIVEGVSVYAYGRPKEEEG